MRFWELREPPGGDYRHVHVSGKLDHPFRLPTVECDECSQSVFSFDAVLPYDCPVALQKHPWLTDQDAEVSMKEFRKLDRELVAALRKSGIKKPTLIPGACLQPGYLDIPSVPTSDFLWSDLWSGLSSIVVSQRVRELLVAQAKGAVAICPVTLRKIGKGSTRRSPLIPKSGEPEDIMEHYRVGKAKGVGLYYHVIVTAQSNYPPGTEPGPTCRMCGEELKPDWKAENSPARRSWSSRQEAWEALTSEIVESVWKGEPVFRLAGRGTVLVTDELKIRLEGMQATNVSFREFPIVQSTVAPKRHSKNSRPTKKTRKRSG